MLLKYKKWGNDKFTRKIQYINKYTIHYTMQDLKNEHDTPLQRQTEINNFFYIIQDEFRLYIHKLIN